METVLDAINMLLRKYSVEIRYAVVGAITTVCCWSAKFLASLFLDSSVVWQNTVLTTIQWLVGVTVAYLLNRKYVFRSKNKDWKKELLQFSSGRLGTGIAGIIVLNILVPGLGVNLWISTLVWTVIEVILNYFISRFWVFRKAS